MDEKPRSTPPPLKLAGTDGSDAAQAGPIIRDVDWSILMARAQDGDGAAYHRLLQDIVPYLRSLASRRHRGPNDVEAAVQDILLTIHSIRQTYHPGPPFGPWLVTLPNLPVIDPAPQPGRA